jgi:cell division protein ZapA
VAQLTVRVNGRDYQVACADGEEEHVRRLAADVNRRVAALVEQIGQVGEARLLLMTTLLLADEVLELRQRAPAAPVPEPAAFAALESLLDRLEGVARQLESA